jgi:hypothetical protein
MRDSRGCGARRQGKVNDFDVAVAVTAKAEARGRLAVRIIWPSNSFGSPRNPLQYSGTRRFWQAQPIARGTPQARCAYRAPPSDIHQANGNPSRGGSPSCHSRFPPDSPQMRSSLPPTFSCPHPLEAQRHCCFDASRGHNEDLVRHNTFCYVGGGRIMTCDVNGRPISKAC